MNIKPAKFARWLLSSTALFVVAWLPMVITAEVLGLTAKETSYLCIAAIWAAAVFSAYDKVKDRGE